MDDPWNSMLRDSLRDVASIDLLMARSLGERRRTRTRGRPSCIKRLIPQLISPASTGLEPFLAIPTALESAGMCIP